MPTFTISPNVREPSLNLPLCLTANKSTPELTVTIGNLSNPAPNQLWTFVPATGGFWIQNPATGLIIASTGAAVAILIKPSSIPDQPNVVWKYAGSKTSWTWQLVSNTDLNLNVRGNGPYTSGTPVLTWTWSRGLPNETWFQTVVSL